MTDPGLVQLLTAAVYGLLALVWSAILEDDWWLWRRWHSPHLALAARLEPFWSGKAKGTGLGLAIARRTVEAHGGKISAATPAGGGLTVDVTLPAGTEHAA